MEQQNKLAKFEKAVYAEVDAKVDLIRREAEAEKESELQRNKDEQLAKSAAYVQKKTAEIKRNRKREVAKYSLDAKRSILKKRGEITERVFDAVSRKLEEYLSTPQYSEYLLQKIGEFSKANALSGIQIEVGEPDFEHAGKIKAAYSLPCEVVLNRTIRQGGFIVRDENDSVYFDETLSQKLAEQKSYFIENSELFL